MIASGASKRAGLRDETLRGLVFVWIGAAWAVPAAADDWPEWRGPGRRGVWAEEGILETFPSQGLAVLWRAPVKKGYAGPAVADGRVFVTDWEETGGHGGLERALCLEAATGKLLWSHAWKADYGGLNRPYGPRATPTVDGERIFALGAMGALWCLETATGRPLWSKAFDRDYEAAAPMWGTASAPLVDGPRLISLVGGGDGTQLIAFDKRTGEERWRTAVSDGEPGYSAPILIEAGGVRQLIVWHPKAVAAFNPETGVRYWEQPFEVRSGLAVATPVVEGRRLLVSAFYNGSMLLELDAAQPAARVLWQGLSSSEIKTDGLHSLISTPAVVDGAIYGVCSYGQLRALELETGRRLWETFKATEHARWASAFLVRHRDRFFINNDRGDLILARLTPRGYQEIARTRLIQPTTPDAGRRQLGDRVNWVHPAYADRKIFTRNDEVIVCASLAAP